MDAGSIVEAAAAAAHKARTTGHACRVERWRVGRLRAALRRMGLLPLEGDEDVSDDGGDGVSGGSGSGSLDAGLRRLAALRHPCLLGLYDPVAYAEGEGEGGCLRQRSVCVVLEAGSCGAGAAAACAPEEGDGGGGLARRLLEGGHDEVCTSLCVDACMSGDRHRRTVHDSPTYATHTHMLCTTGH